MGMWGISKLLRFLWDGITSPLGFFGVAISLIKPTLWLVGRLSDMDFVSTHLKEIGAFLETGWGTLTSVATGAAIIASAIHRAASRNEENDGPPVPISYPEPSSISPPRDVYVGNGTVEA